MEKLNFAYYPGCTRETTGREYDASLQAVFKALEVGMQEIPGWNCCGASSGHSVDYWLAHGLAGRNLALAEKMNMDVAVACPACYLRLKATLREFRDNPLMAQGLPEVLSMPYSGIYGVRHILEIISESLSPESIICRVVRPLTGLRLVAYYGCYLVRPPELTGFDDPENPCSMDILLGRLGAQVLDWRGKVTCCGGSHAFILKEQVSLMVSSIIEAAHEANAVAIVTACPLCQVNLETRQTGKNPLPVFYFTELMSIAFGLSSGSWLHGHLIDPFKIIGKYLR